MFLNVLAKAPRSSYSERCLTCVESGLEPSDVLSKYGAENIDCLGDCDGEPTKVKSMLL